MSESSLSDFTLTLYLKRFKELAKQNIERLSLSKSFFRSHEQATVEDVIKNEEFSKFISSLSTLSKHFKNELVKQLLDWEKDFLASEKSPLTVEAYKRIEEAVKSLYAHDFHEIRVVKRANQLKILRNYNEIRYLSFHYVICTVILGVLYDVEQVLSLRDDTWKSLEGMCFNFFSNPILRVTSTNYPSKKKVLNDYAKILGLLSESSINEICEDIVQKVDALIHQGQKEIALTYLEGIKNISFDFSEEIGLVAAYNFMESIFNKTLKWGEKKKKKRFVQSVVESLAVVLSSVTSLDIMQSKFNRRKSATLAVVRGKKKKNKVKVPRKTRKPTPSLPQGGKGKIVVTPSVWYELMSTIYENFVKKKYLKREWSWPFLSAVLCLCSPEYFVEKYWHFLDLSLFRSLGGGHPTKMTVLDCMIHITGFLIKLGKMRHGVIHELQVQEKLHKIFQVLLSHGKKKDIVSLNEEVYNVISDYIVMIASTYTEFTLEHFVLPCLRSDHVVSENTITGLKTFLAVADQSDINRLREFISEGRRMMDKYPSWVNELLLRSKRKTVASREYAQVTDSAKLVRSPFSRSQSITSMVGFSFNQSALSRKYDVHTLKTDKVLRFSDELGDALARILDTCFSSFGDYMGSMMEAGSVVPRDKVGGMKVFVNALSCVSRLFPQRMDSQRLIYNIIRGTRHLSQEIRAEASKVSMEILEFQPSLRHVMIESFAHFILEMDNPADIQPTVELYVKLLERWILILNRERSEFFVAQYSSPTIFSFANFDVLNPRNRDGGKNKKSKSKKKNKRGGGGSGEGGKSKGGSGPGKRGSDKSQSPPNSGEFTASLLNTHIIDCSGIYCLTNPNYRVRSFGKKVIETLREFQNVMAKHSFGLSLSAMRRKTSVYSLLKRQGMEMIREVMRSVHGEEGRLKQLKLPDLEYFILYSTGEEHGLFLNLIGKLLSEVCPETSSLCLSEFTKKIIQQQKHFEITYKDLERTTGRSRFEERVNLWKNLLSISVGLSVTHKKVDDSNQQQQQHSKSSVKDRVSSTSINLYRAVMPFMKCNYELQRNIVTDALGRVNEHMLDIFFENLKMYEESIRKGTKKKNRLEMMLLRLQLAKLYSNLARSIDGKFLCSVYNGKGRDVVGGAKGGRNHHRHNSPPSSKKERKQGSPNHNQIPQPVDTASIIKQRFIKSIQEQLDFLKRRENMYSPEPQLQRLRYHFFILVEYFVRKYYYGSHGPQFRPIRRELREELVLFVIEFTGVGPHGRQRSDRQKRNLISMKKKNEKEDFEEVYTSWTKRNQHQACLAFTSLLLGRLFTQDQMESLMEWNNKRRKDEVKEQQQRQQEQNNPSGKKTKTSKSKKERRSNSRKKRPSFISEGDYIAPNSMMSDHQIPQTPGNMTPGNNTPGKGLEGTGPAGTSEKSSYEFFEENKGNFSIMIITWMDELIFRANDKFAKRLVERVTESILEGHMYKDMVEFYFQRCYTVKTRISSAYFVGFVKIFKRYELRNLFLLPQLLTLILFQCVSRSKKCRDFALAVLPAIVNPYGSGQDIIRRFRKLMKKDLEEDENNVENSIGKPVYLVSSKLQEFFNRILDFVSKKMSVEYKVYAVDMIHCLHGIMGYIERRHQRAMLRSCVDWLRWIELRKLKVIDERDEEEEEDEDDSEDDDSEDDDEEDEGEDDMRNSSKFNTPKFMRKNVRRKLETQEELLNKLFSLTCKFGDLFPNTCRQIWVTFTSTYEKNIKYVVDFLLRKGMSCDKNDDFRFSILQQIAVYCGMSNIKIIINILISRLQNASAGRGQEEDDISKRRYSSHSFLSLGEHGGGGGGEPSSPTTRMINQIMGGGAVGGKDPTRIIDFVADPTTIRLSDMILILLVELQYKYSRNFRLHFPFLLQHCIMRLDHPVSIVHQSSRTMILYYIYSSIVRKVDAQTLQGSDLLESAKYLLQKFGRIDPRKLVNLPNEMEYVGEDDEEEDEGEGEGGEQDQNNTSDHSSEETPWAVGSLYAYDDPDAPDVINENLITSLRKMPENPRFIEAIQTVLSLFIRTVPNFSEHFGTECLNWAIYSKSYHDIIRSLQVYRLVRSSLTGDVVFTFTYLINKYLEGLFHSTMLSMTMDVFSEILYTLTDLIKRLPPRKSFLYPHLFWVAVGMLQSDLLPVYRSGILFLGAVLDNVGTVTDAVKYVFLATTPFQRIDDKNAKHERSLSSTSHIVGGAIADKSYERLTKRRRRMGESSSSPDLSNENFTGVLSLVLKGVIHRELEEESIEMLVKLAQTKIPEIVESSPSQRAMQVLAILPYLIVHIEDGTDSTSHNKIALGMSRACESDGYSTLGKCFLRYSNGVYIHSVDKFLIELKLPFSSLLVECERHPQSEDLIFGFLERVLSKGSSAHQRAVLSILHSIILGTFSIKKRDKLLISIISLIKGPLFEDATRVLDVSIHSEEERMSNNSTNSPIEEESEGEEDEFKKINMTSSSSSSTSIGGGPSLSPIGKGFSPSQLARAALGATPANVSFLKKLLRIQRDGLECLEEKISYDPGKTFFFETEFRDRPGDGTRRSVRTISSIVKMNRVNRRNRMIALEKIDVNLKRQLLAHQKFQQQFFQLQQNPSPSSPSAENNNNNINNHFISINSSNNIIGFERISSSNSDLLGSDMNKKRSQTVPNTKTVFTDQELKRYNDDFYRHLKTQISEKDRVKIFL